MAIPIDTSKSHFVAFTAIFGAMAAALDLILAGEFYSGIWDSWIFLLSPIAGVILGPLGGFVAIGIGSLVGHIIIFRDFAELLFMIGAPIGAAIAGLVFQKRWKPVLAFYSLLLMGYFIYPISWILPIIGIWDILMGFACIVIFSVLAKRNWWSDSTEKKNLFNLVLCTVIGLESDVLTRVFILVPGQMYWVIYGMTPEVLQGLWLLAGIITPIKVFMAIIVMVTIGYQVLKALPNYALQSAVIQELEVQK